MSSLSKKAPKIALIQLHVPADSTPASQFRRAESFIRQAATNDADLAILPEMALGYCTPDNLFGHATACALALVNFQSLAKVGKLNHSKRAKC
jgi:predicted amidohydrolase